MNCPKCGYQRTAKGDDEIPDYQCPSCGIIYAKYLRHKAGFSPPKTIKISTKKSQPRITLFLSTQYKRIAEKKDWKSIFNKVKIVLIDTQKRIIAAGIVGFLVAIIWSYLSPALFFNNLRNTAIEKDASDLIDYIDFDKLRMNVKASMQEMMGETKNTTNNPMYQAGVAFGAMMADKMIDSMISPSGVKAMITPKNKSDELPDFNFHYVDFNKAKIVVGNTAISLDRTGLFSWIMVGIGTTN